MKCFPCHIQKLHPNHENVQYKPGSYMVRFVFCKDQSGNSSGPSESVNNPQQR